MTRRITVSGLLLLFSVDLAMVALAIRRYPPLWVQAGAWTHVMEPLSALVAYSIAAMWIATRRGEWWHTILRTAVGLGCMAGIIDILGLLVENGLLFTVRGPALQIGVMVTTFLIWAFAGWRSARVLKSLSAGLLAAFVSAGVCAIIAVTAGFTLELFIRPPAPSYVRSWGEYQRSGWTDARAFGLANTLDSAFSHLALSPLIGTVLGGVAAMAAWSKLERTNRIN